MIVVEIKSSTHHRHLTDRVVKCYSKILCCSRRGSCLIKALISLNAYISEKTASVLWNYSYVVLLKVTCSFVHRFSWFKVGIFERFLVWDRSLCKANLSPDWKGRTPFLVTSSVTQKNQFQLQIILVREASSLSGKDILYSLRTPCRIKGTIVKTAVFSWKEEAEAVTCSGKCAACP